MPERHGAIHGIGVDVVEIDRVRSGLDRHGDRFANRILADAEWGEFSTARLPASFLAKRFAAKEALGKAVGTGIRTPVLLRAMWVVHDPLGKPSLAFEPGLEAWLRGQGIGHAHLSISDEVSFVAAFVVLERAPATT